MLANFITFPVTASFEVLRRKAKPDVIFVSQLSPIFMVLPGIIQKWKTGSPLVCWVQDIWPESATYSLGLRNSVAVGLLNAFCGWLYRRPDIVLVQSAAFIDMIARFGVPTERIRVLPNTAPENYRPLSSSEAPEYADLVPQDGFRLMFAGNVGESQDFDTIVAAAALLRQRDKLKWIIIGSGRDEERVKRLIADTNLSDRFYFLGRFPEAEMPKLFAHADAMLVSLKDVPIFALTVPYKIQCYMACGKPIIASINGEGARIINEATAGIAVAASQPEVLAKAVIKMMDSNPTQRHEYALRSRKYFDENYTAAKVHDELERALDDARRLNSSSATA
jgi:glycosyltransferase involved in cell wall biosynthesis